MKRLMWLQLLLAHSLYAQPYPDGLVARLGERYSCALEYSRYASGRPRLVVAGVDTGGFDGEGEVALVRLPDATSGTGVVIDHLATDPGVVELYAVRLIDRRDVAVVLHTKYLNAGFTLRIRDGKLIQIADIPAVPGNIIDLNGDGIPEIVSFCCHNDKCGLPGPSLRWWTGTEYKRDGRRYAAMVDSRNGNASIEFSAPAVPDGRPKRYVVHVYGSNASVLIDDEPVVPEKPFELEEDCHTIRLSHRRRFAAAFVEERTVKK